MQTERARVELTFTASYTCPEHPVYLRMQAHVGPAPPYACSCHVAYTHKKEGRLIRLMIGTHERLVVVMVDGVYTSRRWQRVLVCAV